MTREPLEPFATIVREMDAFADYPDGLRLIDTDWAGRITLGDCRRVLALRDSDGSGDPHA